MDNASVKQHPSVRGSLTKKVPPLSWHVATVKARRPARHAHAERPCVLVGVSVGVAKHGPQNGHAQAQQFRLRGTTNRLHTSCMAEYFPKVKRSRGVRIMFACTRSVHLARLCITAVNGAWVEGLPSRFPYVGPVFWICVYSATSRVVFNVAC